MEFVLSASATCAAPSAFRKFLWRLQTRIERNASEGANSGETGQGSVLECLEGLINFETLRDVLCPINTKFIVPNAADESRIEASAGADGRDRGMGRRT